MRLKQGNDTEVTSGPHPSPGADVQERQSRFQLAFLIYPSCWRHKSTGTAGAAGSHHLQCYNQIIIFVTAQVSAFTLGQPSRGTLTTANQFSAAARQLEAAFPPCFRQHRGHTPQSALTRERCTLRPPPGAW